MNRPAAQPGPSGGDAIVRGEGGARPGASESGGRRRRLPVVVALLVWVVWGLYMLDAELWSLFEDAWGMTCTMVFGSFIAGATSEGGGAVAFPVMTLLFEIEPVVARDFSLMIQAVGMTAASVLIVAHGIAVEWRAVLWAGLGGAVGVVIGLSFVASKIPPPYAKMFFTSLWLSFAVALYYVNRNARRAVLPQIAASRRVHIVPLIVAGIAGGVVSSITGSGLDIITFSILVLVFGVSESVATPTSVVLMASCSVVGFAWKHGIGGGMEPDAFRYWYVCIPVVVIGAPLGARFIKSRSRLFVAGFLYVSIVTQFVFAVIVIPQTTALVLSSVTTFLVGAAAFWTMSRLQTTAGHPP